METEGENDFDRIEKGIDQALSEFTRSAHGTFVGDSLTMTKDGFIRGVIRLQRLRDWVSGLSVSHVEYQNTGGKDGPN